MLILFILLLLIGIVVYVIRKSPIENLDNRNYTVGNLQFSSQEFYQVMEDTTKKHQIPDVSFSRVTHTQGGLFGQGREYLRITRNEYIFDVCAAPFGADFFVSWWLGESVRDVWARIPVINILLGKNKKFKSYYQADTEAMFKGSVEKSFLETVDIMTKQKGVRALTDTDRTFSRHSEVANN